MSKMKKIACLCTIFLLLAGCGGVPAGYPVQTPQPTNNLFSFVEVGKQIEILVDYETGCQYFVYVVGYGKAIYPRLTKEGLMYCEKIIK